MLLGNRFSCTQLLVIYIVSHIHIVVMNHDREQLCYEAHLCIPYQHDHERENFFFFERLWTNNSGNSIIFESEFLSQSAHKNWTVSTTVQFCVQFFSVQVLCAMMTALIPNQKPTDAHFFRENLNLSNISLINAVSRWQVTHDHSAAIIEYSF